jgi:hypothetical protein
MHVQITQSTFRLIKEILKYLQTNKLRFAPIIVNDMYFVLRWNVNTTMLEIQIDISQPDDNDLH